MAIKTTVPPSSGFKGLKENWRTDLISAFSVALVALPLGLGISLASNAPPMAGLWSSIIAGLFMSFYRGTSIGINGPAAGLIIVTLGSMKTFESTGEAFAITLAAFAFAGLIMFLIGLFKLGKFGNLMPSSVIRGMLAAIGVIILAKQLDEAFGVAAPDGNIIEILGKIPEMAMAMNPIIFSIAAVSILILAIYPKIKNRLVHFVPGAMWVLAISIPLALLLKSQFGIESKLFISLPSNIMESVVFPKFTQLANPAFWAVVVSVTFVSSIEGLLSAKGIEKLDPFKRKSDLDKDMVGSGIATILASLIGGLPIITVILRSSVNVNNGGKTNWSNFFHGLLVLIFVVLLSPIIQKVPLASLAGILIFTGYRLASPKIFTETYLTGWEQFLIFFVTLFCTLKFDLIYGVLLGILTKLLVQFVLSGLNIRTYVTSLFNPFIKTVHRNDKTHLVRVKGISNFLTILKLQKEFDTINEGEEVIIDFSHARLVDLTVLEYVNKFCKKYRLAGGQTEIVGLDNHQFSSIHPNAMHTLPPQRINKLNKRQKALKKLCDKNNWKYQREVEWNASYLRRFDFFKTKPIEFKNNIISGIYDDLKVRWEIADITFDEGTFLATEVYNTTVQLIRLPIEIPVFSIEKEDLYDRMMDLADHHDIDFEEFKNFSKKFDVKGPDKNAILEFFKKELIHFFEGEEIYHVESNGEAILVFRLVSRAKSGEIEKMVKFSHDLTVAIKASYNINEQKKFESSAMKSAYSNE